MTGFIADALELLPQPAALFECRDLRYVASNTACALYRRTFGSESPPTMTDAVERMGIDLAAAKAALTDVGTYALDTPFGTVHLSLLPTAPELTRPDLLLLTMHPDSSQEDSWLSHKRMVMALKVNETGEIALRSMENSLVQMQAALSAQHGLMREYNRRAAEFMRLNVPE